MVKLNKIYTRTGDDGTTGLVSGARRKKHDIRIEAYGTVDEANSFIGMARLHTADKPKLDRELSRIQNDLFDLGSDLATPPDTSKKTSVLRITEIQTTWLEEQIDKHNEELTPLTSFVLPGGSASAAALHVARTIVRRAERLCVELSDQEPETPIGPTVYLNRLSDLLFVLARVANANGTKDVLWQPGQYGDSTK